MARHAAAHDTGADEGDRGGGHAPHAIRCAARCQPNQAGPAAGRASILRPVQIINTLAPVFLLIAIGSALQFCKFVSPDFLKEANRLTYWLGLPALLFSQLAGSFH